MSLSPLSQLAVIWAVVYAAVFIAKRVRLAPVLFFLFFGALLVNLGILPKETDPFIRGLAEFGIIVIMFAIGFEEKTSNFIVGLKRSWGIAFFGAVAPFVFAYCVADYYWADTSLSLMFGLTMTATAVSLTLVSLKGLELHKGKAATAIMTSAVLDDIASLALVAVLVPISTGDTTANINDIVLVIAKAIAFFVGVLLLGIWIFPHNPKGVFAKIPILNRIGVKHLFSLTHGEHLILTVLMIALVLGLAAHALGFHPAIGAYMAGLVLKEEYFYFAKHKENHYYEKTRLTLDNAAFSWIGPIFFVELGTKIVLDLDILIAVLPQTFVLTIGLLIVQTSSAGLAARYTAGFSWSDSLMIGLGMLGRAELAFVVMDIAYVQHSILNEEAFYTLMFTAFWLNAFVPIAVSLWKVFLGHKEKVEK